MKQIHPQITQICADFFLNLRNLRTPLSPRLSALAIIALLYLATARAGLSAEPWGQPTPDARWTSLVQRDDPRPFWIRLLLSIRYDFYHKDIRGGAEF
jgi:hypothetical protein